MKTLKPQQILVPNTYTFEALGDYNPSLVSQIMGGSSDVDPFKEFDRAFFYETRRRENTLDSAFQRSIGMSQQPVLVTGIPEQGNYLLVWGLENAVIDVLRGNDVSVHKIEAGTNPRFDEHISTLFADYNRNSAVALDKKVEYWKERKILPKD